MNTQDYYVDCNELGYCVNNAQGTLAIFALVDDAFQAMREFRNKQFPDGWQKVSPSMQRAKQKCYGCGV